MKNVKYFLIVYINKNIRYNIPMNLFQKIIYNILVLREKSLNAKLGKHLKRSSKNSTSKTILATGVTMTLNSETEKNKNLVLKNVSDIVKNCSNNPKKLIDYIKAAGTKVVIMDNADKILGFIKEEEGLICELQGLEAFFLNVMTDSGLNFKSKPMFVMRNGEIDPYYMAHQFYKWYSLKNNLPGYDYFSQKLFKIYLNSDESGMENLTLDEMTGLKEAIDRDKEATEFALSLAKHKEGSKKVLEKMQDGGANI